MDVQEFSPLVPVEFYNNTYNEPLVDFYNENMDTKDDLSDDISDFINEENDGNLSLQKGQIFETFEEVERYLTNYCEQKSFEYRKRRVEFDDDNIIHKRTYECTKAAQYQPKKDKDPEKHCQRSSGSIGCQWHINVTCPKSTEVIKISTIVDEHNHPLNSNIKIHGAQFRRFSKEMKCDILEYLTAVPTMGARTIYRLLTKKYPDTYIHRKNLYNAIQEVRRYPGWVIETRIVGDDFRLGSVLWMSPQQVQLWTRFHDVVITDDTYKTNRYDMALSLFMIIDNHNRTRVVAQALIEDETDSTFQWILDCILRATNFLFPRVIFTDGDLAMAAAIKAKLPNTHHCICLFHINQNFIKHSCVEDFERRWQRLISNYPAAKSYLQNKLYPIRFSWAYCYTQTRFTAGTTTTQRAESENNTIKLEGLHTASLVRLTQQIHMRLEEEKQYAEFEDQKTRNIMISIPHIDEKYFGSILQVLKEFLIPNMLTIAKKEISKSILYEAMQINLSLNLDTLNFEYTPQDDALENKYDWKKAFLKDLMKNIPKPLIIEIWKVQPSIGVQPWLVQYVILLQDGSHICTCLMLINKGIICRHFIKILTKSASAFFNISLIPSRWYNDQTAQLSGDEIRASPSIQLFNNSQSESIHITPNMEYSYLDIMRGGNVFTPELKEIVTDRQQYAKACGLQKKAYNLAKQLGQESEYINLLNNFILSMEVSLNEMNDKENTDEVQRRISNPIYVKPRGRPPQKRYKSSLEPQYTSHTNAELRAPLGNTCQNVDYSLSDKVLVNGESNNSKQMKKCGRL
ncbi:protein FAR1-related sequence 5-like [Rhizophagus clarus]|uniref:Protein FAR1-related sequence 5-like n=1 Tax=Rhizophagus clarus TaxID=94130 RepID=A0A8H3LNB0_9GLOM|nr:protein FAR1-related sequence 5-like [Rhizophagus clarus]